MCFEKSIRIIYTNHRDEMIALPGVFNGSKQELRQHTSSREYAP